MYKKSETAVHPSTILSNYDSMRNKDPNKKKDIQETSRPKNNQGNMKTKRWLIMENILRLLEKKFVYLLGEEYIILV